MKWCVFLLEVSVLKFRTYLSTKRTIFEANQYYFRWQQSTPVGWWNLPPRSSRSETRRSCRPSRGTRRSTPCSTGSTTPTSGVSLASRRRSTIPTDNPPFCVFIRGLLGIIFVFKNSTVVYICCSIYIYISTSSLSRCYPLYNKRWFFSPYFDLEFGMPLLSTKWWCHLFQRNVRPSRFQLIHILFH